VKKRFIFDENYIKRNKNKEKLKWLILGLILLVVIIIVIIVVLSKVNKPRPKPVDPVKQTYKLKESLTIESGSGIPKVEDYFSKLENIDVKGIEVIYPDEFEINYDTKNCSKEEIDKINQAEEYDAEIYKCAKKTLVKPMTYGITIKLLEKEHTINLIIKDTKAPVVVTKDLEIYENDKYTVQDFVQSCEDISSSCEVNFYQGEKDENGNIIDYSKYNKEGKYKIKIISKDGLGNTSEPIEVNLNIKKPNTQLYVVSFDTDGGNAFKNISVESGKKISDPGIPTKEGYTFLGWYLGNNKYNFNSTINSNITLRAKWEKINVSVENPDPKPGNIPVSSVSLSAKTIYVYVGSSSKVSATVKPTNATNRTVSWSSNNNGIATVNKGVITGKKAGTAVITASVGGKSAKVTVVVKNKPTTNTCKFGNTDYNKNYIMSVKLTNTNCAINPNLTPNETISSKDYSKLISDLGNMGFNLNNDNFHYKLIPYKIKNTAGTGLVGYQLTVEITVRDTKFMSASYIIKSDGSRKFLTNNIVKNNVSLK